MNISLEKHEKMLLSLLKSSFNNTLTEKDPFYNATDDSWIKCRELAIRQGVMALAWDGVMLLPKELQPQRKIKIKWALAVEKYENKYKYYCQTAKDLTDFFSQHGIGTIILKGLGLSTYYPIPSHREGGDIDIYTYSLDKTKLSDEEASKKADQLIMDKGIQIKFDNIKHSEYCYKGIPIENHKKFLAIDLYQNALPVERYLESVFEGKDTIINDNIHIYAPTEAFNMLFISYHAMQHYGDGISLHHLYDWACVIKRFGLKIPGEIRDKKLIDFIHNLTQITNDLLGTTEACSSNSIIKKELMYELVRLPYSKYDMPKNRVSIISFKIKRMFHRHKVRRRFFDETLLGTLGFAILFHLRKPQSTFK